MITVIAFLFKLIVLIILGIPVLILLTLCSLLLSDRGYLDLAVRIYDRGIDSLFYNL
jgi:hypothetical protein